MVYLIERDSEIRLLVATLVDRRPLRELLSTLIELKHRHGLNQQQRTTQRQRTRHWTLLSYGYLEPVEQSILSVIDFANGSPTK